MPRSDHSQQRPEPRRTVLPNSRAYARAGTGDHSLFSNSHCCVCGRPCKGRAAWLLLTRAIDGAQEFAISSPEDATEEERNTSMWVAPIGSDCLHKHPELAHAVIDFGSRAPVVAPQIYADGYCARCSELAYPLTRALEATGVPTGADNWQQTYGPNKVRALADFESELRRLLLALDEGKPEDVKSRVEWAKFRIEFHAAVRRRLTALAQGREPEPEPAPSPASSPVPPKQQEPLGKLIIKAVDDAVMRVGASANCYDVPADANSGAEYVAARVRSVITADCTRQAQRSPAATPSPSLAAENPHCWHCGVVLEATELKLRCEQCPADCDDETCSAFGCAPR